MGLRIAQLVNALPSDQMGGLQRYVEELSETLAERGHEVTVVTKQSDKALPLVECRPSGMQLVRTKTAARSAKTYAIRYPLGTPVRTAFFLRARDFDVVHAHFGLQGLGCRLSGRPYWYTFHAPAWAEAVEERGTKYMWPSLLDGLGSAAYRFLERAAVAGASQYLVLSSFMQEQLEDLLGDETRAYLVPGGVDTRFFSPGAPATLCDDQWSAVTDPVLFCARRLVPRMGVGNLIEAVSLLRDEFRLVRLAIAGEGFLKDELLSMIEELSLSHRVRLLGRVSNEGLRDWYRRATVAVIPSVHLEGFGLSAAEALSCGTPVVGAPAGAIPELLGRLGEGMVSADASPRALATAIRRILRSPDRIDRLGVLGRKLALSEWAWTVVAERHEELYRAAS